MDKVLQKINIAGGVIVATLTAVLGAYWYLFAAFLVGNIIDLITGVWKARVTQTENSQKGAEGARKKVGYWLIIAIAFFIGTAFMDLGKIIGIDLGFTVIIGWITLATFIINEIRSILENLVALDVYVPPFLIKGLKVAADKVNGVMGDDGNAN